MEELEEQLEETQLGETQNSEPVKEKKLKPVKIVNQDGLFVIDKFNIPSDAKIVCEQEIQCLVFNTNKGKNELATKKEKREYTRGFFEGVYDLNNLGYSESLGIKILGYK